MQIILQEEVKGVKENLRLQNGQIETQKVNIAEMNTQIKANEIEAGKRISLTFKLKKLITISVS